MLKFSGVNSFWNIYYNKPNIDALINFNGRAKAISI